MSRTLLFAVLVLTLVANSASAAKKPAAGTTLCNTESSQADFERFLGYAPRRATEIGPVEALREKHRLDQVARGRNYTEVSSVLRGRTVDGEEGYEVCVSFEEKKPRLGTSAIAHFQLALADMLVAIAEARVSKQGSEEQLAAMRDKLNVIKSDLGESP